MEDKKDKKQEVFLLLLEKLSELNPVDRDTALRSIVVWFKYNVDSLYEPQEVRDYLMEQKKK